MTQSNSLSTSRDDPQERSIQRETGTVVILDRDGEVILIERWNDGRPKSANALQLFERWRGKEVDVVISEHGFDALRIDFLKRRLIEGCVNEWRARADILANLSPTEIVLRQCADQLERALNYTPPA